MKIFIFYVLFSLFSYANNMELEQISNYKVVNKFVKYQNHNYTILRSFSKNNEAFYLIVDENSLETSIIKKEKLSNITKNSFLKSRYFDLLQKFSEPPYLLQNYGLKHIDSKKIYLTVDMCPSSKEGYEKEFFEALVKNKKHVPITIFISGKWIIYHKKEFLQLISMQKKGLLDITWGNHTFYHRYKPKEKFEKNFLLIANTNIEEEVLKTEQLLLSYKVIPSILFRFPGLVSNKTIVESIKKLGLIPIGTDSWIAKNQRIKSGSILLVHGNKNEHEGIVKVNKMLKTNKYKLSYIFKELNP